MLATCVLIELINTYAAGDGLRNTNVRLCIWVFVCVSILFFFNEDHIRLIATDTDTQFCFKSNTILHIFRSQRTWRNTVFYVNCCARRCLDFTWYTCVHTFILLNHYITHCCRTNPPNVPHRHGLGKLFAKEQVKDTVVLPKQYIACLHLIIYILSMCWYR